VSFMPFVGIAPRLYLAVFAMDERKDKDGKTLRWEGRSALPKMNRALAWRQVSMLEDAEVVRFTREMERAGLVVRGMGGDDA
jgi:hypothetical protein